MPIYIRIIKDVLTFVRLWKENSKTKCAVGNLYIGKQLNDKILNRALKIEFNFMDISAWFKTEHGPWMRGGLSNSDVLPLYSQLCHLRISTGGARKENKKSNRINNLWARMPGTVCKASSKHSRAAREWERSGAARRTHTYILSAAKSSPLPISPTEARITLCPI